ncbi:MAG: hypothetical protein ACPGVG_13080 [Mycobacterium sp.]
MEGIKEVKGATTFVQASRLIVCWEFQGVSDFNTNPILVGEDPDEMHLEYVEGLDALGREGVLSVVREILAERGEG